MMRRLLRLVPVAALLCAMSGYSLNTQSVTSATTTNPVPIIPTINLKTASAPWLPPAVLVELSAGASLTYTVEVTGDDVLASGYNAATGNWAPMTGMASLTSSASATLGAAVTAVRLHVTSYSSGTATIQVVQQTVN